MIWGTKPYSLDLRHRVVEACDAGEWTRAEIAEHFGVSVAWVYRLLQRRETDGTYASRGHRGGRPPAFSQQQLNLLDRAVRQQPDATLAELRERCGVDCSLVTVHNTLARLGYRRKKRPSGQLSKTVRT